MNKRNAVRMAAGLVAGVGLVLAGAANRAHADAAGDGVLAKLDAQLNKAQTLRFEYEIVNKEAGKDERTMTEIVQIKGEKSLTEFSSPADMKGTKILILSPTQIYVYLPAFGKVRRVADHTKDQGFLGLAYSQDDLATRGYGADYSASVASEDTAQWKLVLTPKSGKNTGYARIEMIVSKDKTLPTELKLFDKDGKNIKTETRTNYSCEGEVCTPGETRMTDNVKGNWTRVVAKSRKVNSPISDDVFSKQRLAE